MGCDIHIQAEKRVNGTWEVIPDLHPFDWRGYGMFGFLAGVRNYSHVPQIAEARGLPPDAARSDDEGRLGDHSFSWLLVDELVSFDYETIFEDRRVTKQTGPNSWNGAGTADLGAGQKTTIRDFLGQAFFDDLERLKAAGADRIVFGFDS